MDEMRPDDTQKGWLRREVIGANGQKLGRVVDVLYMDDGSSTPDWAVVDTGLLSAPHFVPLEKAYITKDGRVVVPYDKNTVKRSPKAQRDHLMTPGVEQEAMEHYALT